METTDTNKRPEDLLLDSAWKAEVERIQKANDVFYNLLKNAFITAKERIADRPVLELLTIYAVLLCEWHTAVNNEEPKHPFIGVLPSEMEKAIRTTFRGKA